MKKRFLALVLGGAMAVGSFLQAPVTVQAEDDEDDLVSQGWQDWAGTHDDYCSGLSDGHIKSSNVKLVNGYLTVTLQVEFPDKPEGADYGFGGAVYVCEEQWQPTADIGDEGTDYYDWLTLMSNVTAKKYFNECDGENFDGDGEFTITFDGIASGKTYYVYCHVFDTHGYGEKTFGCHWGVCLGSETPTASPSSSSGSSSSGGTSSGSTSSGSAPSCSSGAAWSVYEDKVTDQIKTAEAGSTVVMNEGVNTLSNAMMRQLLEKGDVSLKLAFTYEDKDYVIIIPAGEALDNDIPWYGPLYLAARYGNSLDNAASAAGSTYEVKSGDSLSKIASRCNMTLKELLAKNPQIKDPNKIRTGQKINR